MHQDIKEPFSVQPDPKIAVCCTIWGRGKLMQVHSPVQSVLRITPHHATVCVPMPGMHGRVWNTNGCTETSRSTKTIAWRSGILQRCVRFITFVIFFTLSCIRFIPFAFISYPNELFLYLVQKFHTYLV